MEKYKIEGGIDFFAELYKSLDIEENNEKTEEDDNKCLITNELLTDKFIKLNCGHKFNYIPLYNDIVNHKKKFNNMEGTNGKLHINEIRCPYCRNKQNNLLPYYEELGLAKINGVNFYDPTIKQTYPSNSYHNSNKCEYLMQNPNYTILSPESDNNKKFIPCHAFYASQISVYNTINPSVPLSYGDNKYYCYCHKKIMIKQYKIEEKEKLKLAAKQAKELEKAQQKAEKEKIKEEIKLAKQKEKEQAKASKKNKIVENIVLGSAIIENQIEQSGCIQILKTGPNKGNPCGCKIYNNNLCKRHIK